MGSPLACTQTPGHLQETLPRGDATLETSGAEIEPITQLYRVWHSGPVWQQLLPCSAMKTAYRDPDTFSSENVNGHTNCCLDFISWQWLILSLNCSQFDSQCLYLWLWYNGEIYKHGAMQQYLEFEYHCVWRDNCLSV